MEKARLTLYDTTLRDGAQTPGVNFSAADKVRLARRLDSLGFPFVEGGFAGSNGIDAQFFALMRQRPLERATLTSFGMTRRKGVRPDEDLGLRDLLATGTRVVALVGKSSLEHARHTLGVGLDENIDMIAESIAFLIRQDREVIFDAEHYYYGFQENPDASLEILKAAQQAGASTIVLCDTASGALPDRVYQATSAARRRLGDIELGVHVHNDSGVANAATLEAIRAGARHVQGTVNGLGERTGNLDWCQFLPISVLLAGMAVDDFDLKQVTELSRYVADISRRSVPPNSPFVGENAFTHKAGMHTDAVRKQPDAYHVITPCLVGGEVSFENSAQGGKANVFALAEKHGFHLERNDPRVAVLVGEMKRRQVMGDAQGLIMLMEVLENYQPPFDVQPETSVTTMRSGESRAEVSVRVNGGVYEMHETGKGSFDAFSKGLHEALLWKYPEVAQVKLTDYKVALPPNQKPGTDADVDVEITFQAGEHTWSSRTRASDEQIANQNALIDAYRYWIIQSRRDK